MSECNCEIGGHSIDCPVVAEHYRAEHEEILAIVRDLAAMEPEACYEDRSWCPFCGIAVTWMPDEHDPDCLWRRAQPFKETP